MNLIDANLLLYAYDESSPNHPAASRWLEREFSAGRMIALCWQSITAFVRISTSSRAFLAPFTVREAVKIVDEWLSRGEVVILTPTERHWEIYGRLLEEGQAAGALAMDAHLAALAMEHGAVLCTTDKDFSRFSGLHTHNPLAGR